jgi:histidine triad (HIT) family protein
MPKKHVPSLLELTDDLAKELLDSIKRIAAEVTKKEAACRIQTNLGNYQGSKHLHVHISSGKPLQ